MTTFASLYQRFQEILAPEKKESEAKKKEREREKSKETWAYTACYFR